MVAQPSAEAVLQIKQMVTARNIDKHLRLGLNMGFRLFAVNQ